MRAHFFQHVPFEGLGSIETWLKDTGYEISSTQFFDSEVVPKIEEVDLLIVMGGPMSVNDEDGYPWLAIEKDFIRRFIAAGKPVLGICLGAQLIAVSMGGEVFANSEKEIGWFPIEPVENDNDRVYNFQGEVDVFHWHGETFSLPKGAEHLAKSKVCRNQAFQIGRNVIGLQFHLETTPATAREIIENCRDEIIKSKYIQSEEKILSAPKERYSTINNIMSGILDYLHANK